MSHVYLIFKLTKLVPRAFLTHSSTVLLSLIVNSGWAEGFMAKHLNMIDSRLDLHISARMGRKSDHVRKFFASLIFAFLNKFANHKIKFLANIILT